MPVLPDTKLTTLEYFEAHCPVWTGHEVAIGLSVAAVLDLTAKTTNARKAYNAMLAARTASKNATQSWYDSYNTMSGAGRDDIKLIKAFADSQATPMTVYTLAQVDPPAPPGPSPIPGTPSNFQVSINPATGAVSLAWKCVGDGNAVYAVSRKFAGDATPTFLANVGEKKFIDTTLPAISGSAMPVAYFITCQRGAMSGATAGVTVQFGAGGGGGGFSVTENTPASMTQPMKMAA